MLEKYLAGQSIETVADITAVCEAGDASGPGGDDIYWKRGMPAVPRSSCGTLISGTGGFNCQDVRPGPNV